MLLRPIEVSLQHSASLVQSNPVNTVSRGVIDSVRIKRVEFSEKVRSFFPKGKSKLSLINTVNSLYRGHCRGLELMSSLARVRNSGSLLQSNVCNLFLPGI